MTIPRGRLPKRLPFNRLRRRSVPASMLPRDVLDVARQELSRATESAGWNPKVVRLRRNLHMVDLCADPNTDDVHSVEVVLLQDHPFLAVLNALDHVPRAVKTLYRKEVRLAHQRADESWDYLRAVEKAREAWTKYLENAHGQ